MEEDIITRAKAGDRAAFEQLVLQYQRKVYTIAYRFMGNPEDANDLAQEALLKMYRSLPGFRGESSFLTWLNHVVANVCRDELRKRQRQVPMVELPDGFEQACATGEGERSTHPEGIIMDKERKAYLQQFINDLPPEYRMALIMRDIQGLSYEEIASVLNLNLGTVKSRINRARHRLKDRLLSDSYFAPTQVHLAVCKNGQEQDERRRQA